MKKLILIPLLFLTACAGLHQTAGPPGAPPNGGDRSFDSVTIGATDFKVLREIAKLDLTADTVLTAAQINAYKWITNQGDDGEADITLPAVSYPIAVNFVQEEAQVMEINPPAGEAPLLDGTALDADDCIDSPGTGYGVLSCFRHQTAAGAWAWDCINVFGTAWVDTGATD